MKEFFRETNFRPESLELLRQCELIIDRYLAQGLRLTLRQLYYQLVTKNLIKNEEKSYKKVGALVSNGRLAGELDWEAIEDRVRVPKVPNHFSGLEELVEAALRAYRLDRWKDQEEYVELWVEKDALAGVLAPLAREFHITLMVNRGYSSQSAMYESADRFRTAADEGKGLHLLYLGDLDPSGEDMVRDIADRLEMFGVHDLDVDKIAITMDQVRQYNPPPNPAKLSDSRAAAYIAKYGRSSWEVDALAPPILQQVIRDAIEQYVDDELMDAVKEREERDKRILRGEVRRLVRRQENDDGDEGDEGSPVSGAGEETEEEEDD